MSEYNLFYSWQSDNSHIRNVIRAAIDKAVKALEKRGVVINIIEDSRTENGAEHIDTGLLESIDRSDLFIADLSPVYPPFEMDGKVKLLPNGNVLFETGYAIARHGNGRCRLVAMLEAGQDINSLPFDINHRKLLIFSDSNREPLKSLERWIESKLPEIEKARESIIPKEAADVFIYENGNCLKEITLHPQFRQIYYNYPSPRKEFAPQEARDAILLGTSSKLDTLLANFKVHPVFQTQVAQPIRRKINLSLLPFNFAMENTGVTQLHDINIRIWTDNPDVRFENTPIEVSFRSPIIKRKGDLFISNDGKTLIKSIASLNPTAIVDLDECYIKLPYTENEIRIRWAFDSSTIHNEGELHIHSIPTYEPEYLESTTKAGQIEYQPIIEIE